MQKQAASLALHREVLLLCFPGAGISPLIYRLSWLAPAEGAGVKVTLSALSSQREDAEFLLVRLWSRWGSGAPYSVRTNQSQLWHISFPPSALGVL